MSHYIIDAANYLSSGLTLDDYIEDNEEHCLAFLHEVWNEAEKQEHE